MIYFHDNQKLVYVTGTGIEKVFKIIKTPGEKKKKDTCSLKEIANSYYNENAFIRRFLMDNTSFNA